MKYYEVLVADSKYHSDAPLTYSWDGVLPRLSIVSIPVRNRVATGFVLEEVKKPVFAVKPIKSLTSPTPLPGYCLELARWISEYYACSLAEALRQYAPSRPVVRAKQYLPEAPADAQLSLRGALTAEQKTTLAKIKSMTGTSVLLHGETGSGKTRVYLEMAAESLKSGRSVIFLTPEISLTSQLAAVAKSFLHQPVYVIHSQLGTAERKKNWHQMLEAKEPVVVVGPRSALFSPLANVGLIVLDEAHEPAYKQDQSPRYQAARVASQLGHLTGAKVILGTATPSVADYYLAEAKGAVIRMSQPAIGPVKPVNKLIVDIKDRANFGLSPHLSKPLIDSIKKMLANKKQSLIYLNRRGSARLILCTSCGWQLTCPHCDIALVYHGDEHLARCHSCGFRQTPPPACPECGDSDIVYRAIGTKTLADELGRLFPEAKIGRFDSDNLAGERLNEVYSQISSGAIDILVGTQLLAKGLDLPRLGLVGIVSAEASLGLPDFTSEERGFQLLYQVMGRVGRGHGQGYIIVQSYNPDSLVIKSALGRDWPKFYDYELGQRQRYRFPPFSYLALLACRRASAESAQQAAEALKTKLLKLGLSMEIIGPVQPFYARKGSNHYSQLIIKSKNRASLLKLAKEVPSGWQIDLDPADLL